MSRSNFLGVTLSVMAVTSLMAVRPSPSAPAAGASAPISVASSAPDVPVQEAYGKLPLSFESNRGQAADQVDFLSKGNGYSLFLTPTEAVLSLAAPNEAGVEHTVGMQVVGADPGAAPIGSEPLAGKVNYLRGSDPSKWITGVPTYAAAGYRDVYPGVDLSYYGKQDQLEYDFIVAPGADPSSIALSFDGADEVRLDHAGDLVLSTPGGELRQAKPVIYQDVAGAQRPVPGSFVLGGSDQVGFDVGAYDPSLPLVIDPVLSYSTYLGGTGADEAFGVAVDQNGSAYVTGSTTSNDFPTSANSLDPSCGSGDPAESCSDVFVTKLSLDGTSIVYSTYIAAGGPDVAAGRANDIAVDADGNAYITGRTSSANFPTTAGAAQSECGIQVEQPGSCTQNAFLTKLDPTGSTLLYSTYLGGSAPPGGGGTAEGFGVALGPGATVYVAGETASPDFPVTVGALQMACAPDVFNPDRICSRDYFLSKIDTTRSGMDSLMYSTYFGGNGNDPSQFVEREGDIAVDAAGNAIITGSTFSSDLPTTAGAYQQACAEYTDFPGFCSGDAFVAKISPSGAGALDLIYSTYLGGGCCLSSDPNERARNTLDGSLGVAVGPEDTIYVTGFTRSLDFPVTDGAFQPEFAGCSNFGCDSFVSKINPVGSGPSDLVYSTYLGTPGTIDQAVAIGVDPEGQAVVTGFTLSTAFPTVDPIQQTCGCFTSLAFEAFVSRINPVGDGASDLTFSTFLGGTGSDFGNALAIDGAGAAYVAGTTGSPDQEPRLDPAITPIEFPTTPSALQPNNAGGRDAFVSKISFAEPPVVRGFSVSDAKVREGDDGTRTLRFTVILSQARLKEATVRFRTVNGTAEEPGDYQSARGTLRFRSGQTSKTVEVSVRGDTSVEPNETLRVELFRSNGAPIGKSTAVGTIVNDDLR